VLQVAPSQMDEFLANLEVNCRRRLPQFRPAEPRKGTFVLVGGGPSLEGSEDAIRRLWERPGNEVYALNSAVDWLIDRRMRPHGCVMMEIAAWPKEMNLRAHKRVTYYLSSFASPDTYERLDNIVQWHAEGPGMDIVRRHIRDPRFLFTMSNAGPTSLVLGLEKGFRQFEAFGMDCSFLERSHAYEHVDEDLYQKDAITVSLVKPFTTTAVLWRQAKEVVRFCYHNPLKLKVHGDGLLAQAHRMYFPQEYANG
jgi:hypothetical protein